MARKWLGRRCATTKASATGPAPISAAMTTSRKNPVMRERSVHPPTDRILRYTWSGPRQPAFFAHRRRLRIRGPADAVRDDVERTSFHLGEDTADVLAHDAEREELDAGEEHHRDDQRRVARH